MGGDQVWVCHELATRGWMTAGEALACGVELVWSFPPFRRWQPSSSIQPQPQTLGNSPKFPGTYFQLNRPPHSESPCLASAGVSGGQQLAALAPTMAGLRLALLGLQSDSALKPRSVELLPREVWGPSQGFPRSRSFQAAATKLDSVLWVVVLGA